MNKSRFYAKYIGLIFGMFYNKNEPEDEGAHEKFFGLANAALDIKRRTDYHAETLDKLVRNQIQIIEVLEMLAAQSFIECNIEPIEFKEDSDLIDRLGCCDKQIAYINDLKKELYRCLDLERQCAGDEECIAAIEFNKLERPPRFNYGSILGVD